MSDAISSKDEILKRCEEWFAAYMHDRESYDEATLIFAALRNGAEEPCSCFLDQNTGDLIGEPCPACLAVETRTESPSCNHTATNGTTLVRANDKITCSVCGVLVHDFSVEPTCGWGGAYGRCVLEPEHDGPHEIPRPAQKSESKPSASTDEDTPLHPSPSSVECPKCRTQLAFEGDVCGLCNPEFREVGQ